MCVIFCFTFNVNILHDNTHDQMPFKNSCSMSKFSSIASNRKLQESNASEYIFRRKQQHSTALDESNKIF